MTTKIEVFHFARPFQGAIRVPGSKSLTNRVLPLAALSGKPVHILDALQSEDTEVMIAALRQFGVEIETLGTEGANFQEVRVHGTAGAFRMHGDAEINCRNSGTTLRFLTALAALRDGNTVLTGVSRMKARPIADLVTALQQLGVHVKYLEQGGFPPLRIHGHGALSGGTLEISGKVSSQFVSAVLLLLPFLSGRSTLSIADELVSEPYVEMTLALLQELGARIQRHENEFSVESVAPNGLEFPNESFQVEGDATAATYPLAIAALTKGAITVQNLYSDSWQGDMRFAPEVLAKMGCRVQFSASGLSLGTPNELQPLGEIDLSAMPDAAMTAVVLAAAASGRTKITGLGTLRHKECDRIEALTSNLRLMGAKVENGSDWIEIWGDPKRLHGAEIETFDDHRVAMAFACLGSIVPGVFILNPECVGKTYPTFWEEYEYWRENSR